MSLTTLLLIVLSISTVVLLISFIALSRQVGVLFERVAPLGALMTDTGPKPGDVAPVFRLESLTQAEPVVVGGARDRSTLIFFLAPGCPVCKKLLPVVRSIRRAESAWLDVILASDGEFERHREFIAAQGLSDLPYVLSPQLGISLRVGRLPYGVVIDEQGRIAAKGLVNNREQLESLLNAKELGVTSVQGYIAQNLSAIRS